MDFIPLDLWRASSLAGETKAVIAAYERCLAAGDFEALAALRQAIEVRRRSRQAAKVAAFAVARAFAVRSRCACHCRRECALGRQSAPGACLRCQVTHASSRFAPSRAPVRRRASPSLRISTRATLRMSAASFLTSSA